VRGRVSCGVWQSCMKVSFRVEGVVRLMAKMAGGLCFSGREEMLCGS